MPTTFNITEEARVFLRLLYDRIYRSTEFQIKHDLASQSLNEWDSFYFIAGRYYEFINEIPNNIKQLPISENFIENAWAFVVNNWLATKYPDNEIDGVEIDTNSPTISRELNDDYRNGVQRYFSSNWMAIGLPIN
jgi:hypothetical protein